MIMRHPIIQQFLRFASVGVIGTFAQYLVLWIGVEFIGYSAALSSGIGYLVGSAINYYLNYHFTFNSNKSHAETASKFSLIVMIGWSINTSMMWLLADRIYWNYWLSQVLATSTSLLWNFMSSRLWAFQEPENRTCNKT